MAICIRLSKARDENLNVFKIVFVCIRNLMIVKPKFLTPYEIFDCVCSLSSVVFSAFVAEVPSFWSQYQTV